LSLTYLSLSSEVTLDGGSFLYTEDLGQCLSPPSTVTTDNRASH
jgi:hypothetical protein